MIGRVLKRRRAPQADGSRGGQQGGFTLVELLVSIALLGLISVAMAGSLRFGARVWDTGAARGEWLNRAEITQNFLRQHIGQAAPPRSGGRGGVAPEALAEAPDAFADEPEQAFSGAPGRLRFVAPAPVQAGVGGFSRFDLFVNGGVESRALVLSISLGEVAESAETALETSDARVLIEGIEAAAFRYYGTLEGDREADWHDEWSDPERLPALVALRVSFPEDDRRVWPELVIALRLGGSSTPPR